MTLSDRFRILESMAKPRVQNVRMMHAPVRNLQLALRMAGQETVPVKKRLPVRMRLGPKPGQQMRKVGGIKKRIVGMKIIFFFNTVACFLL